MTNYFDTKKVLCIALILVILTSCVDKSEEQGDKEKDKSKGEPSRPFTAAELQKANEALENGVRIEDQKDDFYKFPEGIVEGDGRPNNDNPYPLGYTDLKSFTVAADETYLYLKYEFWDKFPTKLPSYDGDLIWSTGAKVDQVLFYRDGKADLAELEISIMYSFDHPTIDDTEIKPLEKPVLGQSSIISPTGIDPTSETLYITTTGAGLVAGGSETDYLLSAVPLDILGLKLGDEIIFSVADETGSSKYHHASVDLLLQEGNNKSGDKIRYKLGSSTYERMSVSDYEKLPEMIELDKKMRKNDARESSDK